MHAACFQIDKSVWTGDECSLYWAYKSATSIVAEVCAQANNLVYPTKKVIVYRTLTRRSAIGLSALWMGSVWFVLCMGKVHVTVQEQVIT
jgi:hypothetical protein